MTEFKSIAIEYAKQGFAVFPLKRNRKVPVQSGGFKNATTDIQTVNKFWSDHPYSNIGIACGQMSGGLLVIDLDIKEEQGIDGRESLYEWQKEHGDFPETATAVTGSGGQHLYFRVHKNYPPKVGILPGVDIRCDGSYVVAPGSIHENGHEYFWDLDPDEYPIAEANDSVMELLNLQDIKAESEAFQMPEQIKQGFRVNTLFRLAASLQSKGLTDEAIKVAVHAENEKKCSPPLTELELEKEVFPALKRYAKGEFLEAMPLPGDAKKKRDIESLRLVSADDLQKAKLPPITFRVDEFLADGVTILAAKSKDGKSWLCLQMAIAVANGDDFLGFPTTQSDVLYLDYENGPALTQDRLNKALNGRPAPPNLFFLNETERFGRGFKEQITKILNDNPKIGLIVIDVLQYVRFQKESKQSDYDADYQTLAELKALCKTRPLAIVCIHHLRKMVNDSDPFDNLLGSTALMGASDETIVLGRKKRSDSIFTITVTGRTLMGGEYKAEFNKANHQWIMLGTEAEVDDANAIREYEQNPLVKTVKTLLQIQPEWKGTCSMLKDEGARMGLDLGSEKVIGRNIKNLEEQLFLLDNINHKDVKTMTSREHLFYRFKLPGNY